MLILIRKTGNVQPLIVNICNICIDGGYGKPYGTRMDWQAYIKKLRKHYTLAEIASLVRAPVSTLGELSRGATRQPRCDLAMRLLALRGKRSRA